MRGWQINPKVAEHATRRESEPLFSEGHVEREGVGWTWGPKGQEGQIDPRRDTELGPREGWPREDNLQKREPWKEG